MIKMRALTDDDMVELDRLHDKYFRGQFEKTDFSKGMLGAFVITDMDDNIVMGGGVRPITEAILVTDKEANPHLLGDALLEAQRFCAYITKVNNVEFLHAFVKDKEYAEHLIKHGFHKRAQALYMSV